MFSLIIILAISMFVFAPFIADGIIEYKRG